jgi:tetratricopeptide (TPR) repeat protein
MRPPVRLKIGVREQGDDMVPKWLILAVLSACCADAWASRPPMEIPEQGALVLETLPAGYPGPAARSAAASLDSVDALFAGSRQTGDMRLAARGEATLQSLPAAQRQSARGLRMRAAAAQHRHDFSAAAALLDQALALDARDAGARIARAQIHLVQGRINDARKDCVTLAIGIDLSAGTLCAASVALRKGELEQAALLVDRWMDQGQSEPEIRRNVLVMRGDIASRADEADADKWFQAALRLRPSDVRTLSAYARHMNHVRRHDAALALLASAPAAEGLELQEAVAALASGHPDGRRKAADLAQRYATTRSVGMLPELRDEAELELAMGNRERALELALLNFRSQRDYEDTELLVRAASAVDRPEALAPAHAWARRENLELPELEPTR